MNFVSVLLICAGLFFLLIAALGAIRLPDFYTRSHAIAVTDTLGSLLLLGGLCLYYGFSVTSAKILFLILFLHLANPVITHILMRSALRSGLKPWQEPEHSPHD